MRKKKGHRAYWRDYGSKCERMLAQKKICGKCRCAAHITNSIIGTK